MMKINQVNNVKYLTFPSFDEIPFLYHAFSTREGGVSKGIFESMNLSFGRGDDEANVIKNFENLCNAIGIKTNSLVFSSQTHTSNILSVTEKDCGKGIFSPKTWNDIDGLLTATPFVSLVTHYADCVPLFFADKKRRVVGTAHAGWKGTVLGIAKEMVNKMKSEYMSDPKDIFVGIGPSIGACCFEVDSKTADEFSILPSEITNGNIIMRKDKSDPAVIKYDINLQEINRQILISSNIPYENIEMADICTKCNHEWLISHRATDGKRGGMAAIIGIWPRQETVGTEQN